VSFQLWDAPLIHHRRSEEAAAAPSEYRGSIPAFWKHRIAVAVQLFSEYLGPGCNAASAGS